MKLIPILIPIIGIILSVFVIFSFPMMISHVQSESDMCGKIMHGPITHISSLKSDKNIEGSFFLGMGSIHTERVYVAYTGNNIHGYTLVEYPISESRLFEDENITPYIEEVDIWTCYSMGYIPIKKYDFHVPVGTIKMEYSVTGNDQNV